MTDRPPLGTDPAEDAVAAMAVFGNVLNQVDDEHLELETPCADWDVQALISHVVLGDASIPLLFDGKPLDVSQAINPSILGPNPMATWRGTALAAIEAFRRPGAMEQVVAHPVGDRPGSVVARFRLVDVLTHAWDLATACNIPLELPDELAEAALEFLFPMFDQIRGSEFFSTAGQVEPPEDASPGVRLVSLLGRSV
jgi:uncharacterized protein (TIGR03086 family)